MATVTPHTLEPRTLVYRVENTALAPGNGKSTLTLTITGPNPSCTRSILRELKGPEALEALSDGTHRLEYKSILGCDGQIIVSVNETLPENVSATGGSASQAISSGAVTGDDPQLSIFLAPEHFFPTYRSEIAICEGNLPTLENATAAD